jgi:hypothetical protein
LRARVAAFGDESTDAGQAAGFVPHVVDEQEVGRPEIWSELDRRITAVARIGELEVRVARGQGRDVISGFLAADRDLRAHVFGCDRGKHLPYVTALPLPCVQVRLHRLRIRLPVVSTHG